MLHVTSKSSINLFSSYILLFWTNYTFKQEGYDVKVKSISVKEFFIKFKNEYLGSRIRKIEFVSCIICNIILWSLQVSDIISIEWKSIIGQMQGFTAVYLAFRFGTTGTAISIIFNVKDLIAVTIGYINTQHFNYIVGMIFVSMTLMWVLIMGILSIRQERQKREMRRLAITDELTGAFNQRFFHSTLEREINNAYKNNNSIGLILVDIDNFRMHNDLYGHDYGDTVLKGTAMILKQVVDGKDAVFRFGGDEFAILVKNKDLRSLELEAKRIHEDYQKIKKDYYNGGLASKITISIGLSEYPDISSSKEELITHADMALYQAKNMGEDKINFYQDIMLQIHKSMKSDEQMIGAFKGLLSTITAKDKYTVGHCERVASYAVMIGEAMRLEFSEVQTLLYAGLLHDIGKIELPKSVLNKIGRLTDEEYELIRQHPIHSANILEPLSSMGNLVDYVRHHHERYDGKGYPDGLAGEQISLGSRILCVADSFDAMVSDRPYRKSMSVEEAFMELERCAGTQFDPRITKLFINIMRNKMSIKYNYKIEINGAFIKPPALQNV